MARRSHSLNAYESGLASGAANTGDFIVDSAVGLFASAANFMYLVVDPDDQNLREFFTCVAVDTGTGVLTVGQRGLSGSANGAQAHDQGAKVRAVAVHQWLDDIYLDIIDLEDWDTDHIAAVDPHPGYLTPAEGDGLYLELDGSNSPMTGLFKLAGDGSADVDPTTYQQMVAADAATLASANQYADGLDADQGQALTDHNIAVDAHDNRFDNYLPLAGGIMLDSIDMSANKILDVGAPTLDGDAANKLYVDNAISAFSTSHDDLDDVSTSDHHVKYTDAEAVAALAAADDYVKLVGDTMSGPLNVDTNVGIDYAASQAQFINRVSSVALVIGSASIAPNTNGNIDLGALGLKWDNLHVNQINGGPATFANVEAVLSELVTWANGQAAGITALS